MIGFKSFLDPTEVNLTSGLTGVVGPNGCGKSNIVEAIKWVMGENSPKQMRSPEMNSIIFSGTNDRPSRNFAEVIIKIDNSEKKLPYPYTNINEIEISRKLERDKGSTYKINGKNARARDVQLIFADSGTGSKSSGIVGQGKITEIIESKPEVRRNILEEAANITGLHNRKHESQLKLNSAANNLDRLSDIELTIQDQINDLSKQARQAARYRSVGERLRKAETSLFITQFVELDYSQDKIKNKITENSKVIEDYQRKISNLETKKLNFFNELPSLKKIDNSKTEIVQNLKIGKIKLEQEINSHNQRKISLENQITQIDEEYNREEIFITDAKNKIKYLSNEIQSLNEKGFNFSKNIEEAQKNTSQIRKKLEDSTIKLTDINSKIISLSSNKKEIKEQLEIALQNKRKNSEKLLSLETQDESLRLKELKEKIKAIQNEHKQVIITNRVTEKNLKNLENNFNSLKGEKITLESDVSNFKTEIETIKNFITLDDKNSLESSIEKINNLEGPIAYVLGESLSASIVSNKDQNKENFWLRGFENNENIKLPNSCKPLTEDINDHKILKNSLKGVGLVKNSEKAFELQKELTYGQVLTTPKGGLWRWDGYVELPNGRNSFANRLVQKKRYKSLLENLNKSEIKLNEINNKIIKIEEDFENTKSKKLDEIGKIDHLEKEINKTKFEITISENKINQSNDFIKEFKSSSAENDKRINELEIQLDKFDNLSELQTDELKVRSENDNLKSDFEVALSNEKKINSDEEYRNKNLDQLLIEQKEWELRKKQSLERCKNLSQKKENLSKEINDLVQLPDQMLENIKKFDEQLIQAIKDQKNSEDDVVRKETEIRDIEKEQKDESLNLEIYKTENIKMESELNIIKSKVDGLNDKVTDKLSISLKDLLDANEDKIKLRNVDQNEIQSLEASVERLVRERENLGAVNLRAEIEINELKSKLLEMQNEKEDLSLAIKKLEDGISELNKEGRNRLRSSFDQVNDNFKKIFTKLFNGGNAELKLIGSDDPLQSGLEIFASPPEKKMQSLSLLSGGEQALTSISLIFAVYLSNPSPLCILDEVDAALDDTNVGRFCDILKYLSDEQDISFLIVTHHRLTMAKMNKLLGVTMEEKGISKLLSVDLEKAVEIKEAS